MKKHLIFDIDGTIFDGEEIFEDAFAGGFQQFVQENKKEGLEIPKNEDIMDVIGIPIDEIFNKLFPMLDSSEKQNLNDICTNNLTKMIRSGGGKIFDDCSDTLKLLYDKGYSILIGSNGRREYIEAILETNNMFHLFSDPKIYLNKKIVDKTAIVKEYIDHFKEDNLFIMIGDRFTDRDAAKNNSIPFIGCEFGHADISELEGADAIVQSFKEIPDAVETLV